VQQRELTVASAELVPRAQPEALAQLAAQKQPGVGGYPRAPDLNAELNEGRTCLEDLGSIRAEAVRSRDGGWPSVRFRIKPRVSLVKDPT
jgi:hypothetical protein